MIHQPLGRYEFGDNFAQDLQVNHHQLFAVQPYQPIVEAE
jgi:hypothetical protein